MYRNILLAGALALTATTVAGCHMYMDDGYDDYEDDGYSYCDDTGCYWCDDWGCYPEGGGGEGWECTTDYDCAAGCYCADYGYCEESPFCENGEECPEGWTCDDRSTCVPPDGVGGACLVDADCPEGSYCDETSGYCVGSETCDVEGNCPEGYECDPERNTCVPAEPDPATCQGEVTCEELPPTCEDGTNPGIVNGCYNGECIADEECPDGAPVYCEDHDNEESCTADDRCDNVYRGINCQDPDGESCTTPGAMCECESFRWHECVTAE